MSAANPEASAVEIELPFNVLPDGMVTSSPRTAKLILFSNGSGLVLFVCFRFPEHEKMQNTWSVCFPG